MSSPSATSTEWTLSLFGRPKVTGRGYLLDQFDTKRAVFLLARLALSHRKALTRSEAAELLWPDDFFDATRLRLRQELARLRRGLGPARDIVDTDEEWIRLADRDLEVDVRHFERLFQASRQAESLEERERCCREAIQLSEEPFLAGLEEPWIDAERARLHEIRYAMLVDLAGLLAKKGDHHAALEMAKRAVEADPLQEAGHLVVMQELGKLGHLSDALGQYQNLKRLLRDELAESPSAEAERVISELRQPGPTAVPVVIEPRSVGSGLTFSFPAPTEPIYGRAQMLEHLCRLLTPEDLSHRLVCLTGPGGIGKTRLAAQVAMLMQDAYEGRVGWISLADISDPANIPTAIASTLGVTLGPNTDPMERIAALMPREPVLLILDNLEQLLPEGLGAIKALANCRPALRLLMTSRVALNLGGERAISVGPLPLPRAEDTIEQPAMRVFLDPLLAEQGFQEPTQEDLAILRQITEKLEGIPLALQLASGRLRTVTPAALLDQLDNRLDMVNRRSDAPERHRTIRTAIAGSFQALDADLQRTMGRLAVFRGGWTQSAATFVCELEDPLPVLEKLLDYSLIRVDREDRGLRFRMLETIRDYVRETIPAEELRESQLKHADWLIEMGNPADWRRIDVPSIELFKTLDAEVDNIREACRFCLSADLHRAVLLGAAFGRFWNSRSLIREATTFYEELFKHLDELPVTPELAHASFLHSQLLFISQRFSPGDIGNEVAARTARLCQELGLEVEYGLTFLHQARTPHIAGDQEESLRLLGIAKEIIFKIGSTDDQALVYQNHAQIHYYQGKVEEAIAEMLEATRLLGADSPPFHQVQTCMMLSFMNLELNDLENAKHYAYLGLEKAESFGVTQFIPMIQEACGKIAQLEGDLDRAAQWFGVSATSWDFFGNMYQYADQLHNLARVHLARGEAKEALPLLSTAAKMWQSKGLMSVVPCALTTAARAYLLLGNPVQAARCLGAVKNLKSPTRDGDFASEIAYSSEIQKDLEAALGVETMARIFGEAPELEAALIEAFA